MGGSHKKEAPAAPVMVPRLRLLLCTSNYRCSIAFDDQNRILLLGRAEVFGPLAVWSRQASNFTEMWVQEQQCWRAAAQEKNLSAAASGHSLGVDFLNRPRLYSGAASDAGRP